MTLATHSVVGAAIASTMPTHPVLGFCLGFGSHFLLDAIPHWDYPLRSSKWDDQNPLNNDMIIGPAFFFDLAKIGFDAALGLLVVLLLFSAWLPAALLGALAGMIPDFLQFVYFKTRWRVIGFIQKFHMWIHTNHKLDNRPVFGVLSQLVLLGVVIFAFSLLGW